MINNNKGHFLVVPSFGRILKFFGFQNNFVAVNGNCFQQSINVNEYLEALEDKIANPVFKHTARKIIISLLIRSVLCTLLLIICIFPKGQQIYLVTVEISTTIILDFIALRFFSTSCTALPLPSYLGNWKLLRYLFFTPDDDSNQFRARVHMGLVPEVGVRWISITINYLFRVGET